MNNEAIGGYIEAAYREGFRAGVLQGTQLAPDPWPDSYAFANTEILRAKVEVVPVPYEPPATRHRFP